MTFKEGPGTERIKMYNGRRPITLGIQMMLANGSNSDIYDDFKLKKQTFWSPSFIQKYFGAEGLSD